MEFEYSDSDHSNVKNRLKQNIKFWCENLKTNKAIVNVLKEGYKLPLYTVLKSANFNINKSAPPIRTLFLRQFKILLKTNKITEFNELPHVVNPLSVTVQNSGKKRLILDLRYVNKHIYKERIKFGDLRLMEQFSNPHQYMFKFDIKQGYHHIDIHKPRQKILGFPWEVGEKTCYFVLTVVLFGLTSAPFIFTKVMRCLVKHWRINAIRIACFLDDGLGVASSYKMTLLHPKFVNKSL